MNGRHCGRKRKRNNDKRQRQQKKKHEMKMKNRWADFVSYKTIEGGYATNCNETNTKE